MLGQFRNQNGFACWYLPLFIWFESNIEEICCYLIQECIEQKKTETYLIYSILFEGIWDNEAETSLSKTDICLTNDVYEYKAIGFETGGRQTMF